MTLPMYGGSINSPSTKLVTNINATTNVISLYDASILPAAPNIFTIGEEEDCETVLYTSSPINNIIMV